MFLFTPYLTKFANELLPLFFLMTSFSTVSAYERNKAAPVENMPFPAVDEARVVYLISYVRVDIAM
ncbi:hypothetical protein L3V77_19365 [Vibrio sp. DW001]|uniref:hypothetical protein n=1 Tax=Vibrio sp. DW001 TaxID=2912315 RepID=UPI0023AF40FE|nr:hypothetical protein [Vibrio sp. DW001]WED29581.1 hypothetical protein L3V77_19365 [Vibrio sp. DW001]